jgi:two-component system CheB/CheR fusion protein
VDLLLDAVSALASARSLDEVMGVIRRTARALVGADGVSFVLRDEGMCYYADEDAIAPLWKGRRFPLEACISGWVMCHREAAAVRDIYADPRIPHEAYRPTFVKSLLMVPVGIEDPIAAIGAYWAHPHDPTSRELATMQGLANAAALSLRNASLNEELERSLRREREARERAEDANKLKDDFLATLSHEMRSPLHVIQGWLWQLRRSGDPEQVHKALEIIERNTTLQARLVEDLLDMSRATMGKLRLQVQLVNLAAMSAAVLEVVEPSARAKNIRVELQRDRTPYIWGDPDRIQQILWNVLSNAIKFTPPDGRVLLRVTREARRVCVSVEDTGIGVDPEFLPFMFDRFRQADQSSSRRFGGLGLGLNIVRELAQLHGAGVRARSGGLGQGTVVTIEFPVPAVLDQPNTWLRRRAAGIELPHGRLGGLSVLVVDDEPEGLSAIGSILQHHGAEVLKAGSADEALLMLRQHRPAILLTDLAMPGQDGFELVRTVRQFDAPLCDIPAAMLSAHLASEYASRATQAGFQMFIEKPVRPQELVGQIAHLAGREQACAATAKLHG